MKVFIQQASLAPKDWIELDSTMWPSLPQSPVPSEDTLESTNNFYINAVNMQGVIFSAYDHYAVIHLNDQRVDIICWDDDFEDHEGDFKAIHWMFGAPIFDEKIGKINTKQRWSGYYQSEERKQKILELQLDILDYIGDWEEFVLPERQYIRHGIWMSDALYEAHKPVRRVVSWREWIK